MGTSSVPASDSRGRAALRGTIGAIMSLALTACAAAAPPSSSGYDAVAAADQARTFHTLATGDDLANYGAQFSQFCLTSFGFDCNRSDRDIEGVVSAEEIQRWDAEKNNPQSVLADIGIMFIPQAEAVGVLADYEPPNASLLPDDLHGPGWVATFVGVPAILANVDALAERGLEVPETWAELADPAYAGLVGISRVGIGANGTWSFVAMNLAAGGTLDDWQPGIEYGRRLLPNLTQQASLDTFERGEVPISIRLDYSHTRLLDELEQRGINYRFLVPADGSVYGPATLMMNRYDTAHHDFAKMFMEWIVSDVGQRLFAPSGARPVRAMLGDQRLSVPADMRPNWLPDANYDVVRSVDWQQVDAEEILRIWEDQVVGGG